MRGGEAIVGRWAEVVVVVLSRKVRSGIEREHRGFGTNNTVVKATSQQADEIKPNHNHGLCLAMA